MKFTVKENSFQIINQTTENAILTETSENVTKNVHLQSNGSST